MPRPYHQLDLDERRRLFRLVDARVPVATIAIGLGRHRSTVYREIRRNRVHLQPELRRYRFHEHAYFEGYFPITAQDISRERRRRLGKLARDQRLRDHVMTKLQACWSPQQIAGRLKLEGGIGATICHETIYQHVYGPQGRAAALYKYLPKARRRRQPRYGRKPRASFVPASRAIEHRPAEVDDRSSFGHWEADLLIFRRAYGPANLTSMVERQTRFTVLLPNPDRRSQALVGRIAQSLQGLPPDSCRTMTFDRGSEFAAYGLLADRTGTEAFFCDPHSPWQKGAVENANGRIRRFLPGEHNLAELTADELAGLVTRLNTTPRRCLGYRTPQETFHAQLAALAQVG